ncbi:hypothetical protein wVul_0127 [Wolbachia endosymbiont of Armadillidium vulgare str. wVulC]|uniref:hypothetical protein n=1 Tax=Wolbachia endosymbiont of Armadillidium vulgare TaxID=77039 RepID=UPI00064AFAE7|nr:hypothetical protein [Wolbachia endosymbiont of Armadillidium vulgare]KLT22924.1 hypothetical protein wVul_0127 [Wolbachia endosymbiont of Armadillidium vulgare str. wVulC]
MNNLLNKGNTFYFIASSLATLTLLTSLVLINVPSSLILALAALSALALMLLYKIMSNNRRIENKFTQKERELEEKITLAAKKIENLKDQLTREEQNLNREVNKVNVLESKLESERESLERKLEAKKRYIEKLEKITKDKFDELLSEILLLREQLQKKEANLAEKEKCITELKRKIDNNKRTELKNAKLHKEKEVEKLSKEKEDLLKRIGKISKDKEILSEEIEELHRKKDTLNNELSEQQDKIKRLTKEKKYLSEELEKKSEELNQANGSIEDRFLDLTKDYDNKVRSFKISLLEKDDQINKVVNCIIYKIEETKSGDSNTEAVLKELFSEIQTVLKELEEKDPESSEFEDSGYANFSSTPTKLLDLVCTKHHEYLDRDCRM